MNLNEYLDPEQRQEALVVASQLIGILVSPDKKEFLNQGQINLILNQLCEINPYVRSFIHEKARKLKDKIIYYFDCTLEEIREDNVCENELWHVLLKNIPIETLSTERIKKLVDGLQHKYLGHMHWKNLQEEWFPQTESKTNDEPIPT